MKKRETRQLKTLKHIVSNHTGDWDKSFWLFELIFAIIYFVWILRKTRFDKLIKIKMMPTYNSIFSIFVGLTTFFNLADSLMFNLEPNSRKCLKEEIHKGVLVTGDYDANQIPNQVVDLMVIDTKGQHFVNRENTDVGKRG